MAVCQFAPGGLRFVLGAANALFEVAPGGRLVFARGLGKFPLRAFFLRTLSGRLPVRAGRLPLRPGRGERALPARAGRPLRVPARGLGKLPLRGLFLRALSGRCQFAPGGFGFVLGATSALFQLAPGGRFGSRCAASASSRCAASSCAR